MALKLKKNVIEHYHTQENTPKKYSILLVDDEDANLAGLAKILSSDYNVMVASNGTMALNLIHSLTPPEQIHLIISDQRMPEMTGVELFEKIIHVIPDSIRMLLTGFADINAIIDSINRGAVYKFLTKPIEPTELRVTVQRALETFELTQKNKTLVDNLTELNASLERKVIERTCELAEKQKALEQANTELEQQIIAVKQLSKLKEDMELISRHDLKSPLNAVINMPLLIKKADNLTIKQKEYLDCIAAAGYKMLDIINNSLSLYKMENGIYHFQPIPINLIPIFKKLILENRNIIDSKKLTIDISNNEQPLVSNDFFIIGESVLCYTLFGNLFKNAIEASPDNKTIYIDLAKETLNAVIKIRNYGSVPEHIRENFFDKYVTANKKNGTGLGTYSAYLSAKNQKGSIQLDTTEALMTSVTVRLPLPQQAR